MEVVLASSIRGACLGLAFRIMWIIAVLLLHPQFEFRLTSSLISDMLFLKSEVLFDVLFGVGIVHHESLE